MVVIYNNKKCGPKSKSDDVWTMPEIVKMSDDKFGLGVKYLELFPKDVLCKALVNDTSPDDLPREEVIFNPEKECGKYSKSAYTKDEILRLAVKYLGITRKQAMKSNMKVLCAKIRKEFYSPTEEEEEGVEERVTKLIGSSGIVDPITGIPKYIPLPLTPSPKVKKVVPPQKKVRKKKWWESEEPETTLGVDKPLFKKYTNEDVINMECVKNVDIEFHKNQYSIIKHLLNNRGLLAIHGTGCGKTLAAVASAECYLKLFPNRKVLVITPTSLQENFKNNIRNYYLAKNEKLSFKKYIFASYSKIMNEFKRNPSLKMCNGNFVILDEAHTLRSQVIVTSTKTKGVGAQSILKCSSQYTERSEGEGEESKSEGEGEESESVLSAGSDVLKSINKGAHKVLLLTATPVLNHLYDISNLIQIIDGKGPITPYEFDQILNDDVLFEKYFKCKVSMFEKCEFDTNFPRYSEHEIIIQMNKEYYKNYYSIELAQLLQSPFGQNPMTFYHGVRRAANKIDEESQKIQWVIDKVKDSIGKKRRVVVYSSWIESGINILKDRLDEVGIKNVFVSGSLIKAERDNNVKKFNNDENEVNVLLISKAGGEGLDLKGVRDIILLEPVWNKGSEDQIIGRAIRYKSHTHLPLEEQLVDIWKLYLDKPQFHDREKGDIRHESADIILKNLIESKQSQHLEFYQRLSRMSIENNVCEM